MKKVVTAASEHGSTAQIAVAIGEQLTAAGHDVHVRDPDVVRDLDGIDAVVLGSAVCAGRWPRPARELVTRLGPGHRRPAQETHPMIDDWEDKQQPMSGEASTCQAGRGHPMKENGMQNVSSFARPPRGLRPFLVGRRPVGWRRL
jgi:Flavodoxin domain